MTAAGSPVEQGSDPYAPFVPRAGRLVAYAAAGLVVIGFVLVAVLLPGRAGADDTGGWSVLDRVMLAGLGALIALFLYRLGSIRAVPDREGLTVRNIFIVTRVRWEQIVHLQSGYGAPWVILELDDTDQLAVMAIQRSDGEYAERMASRLAALIHVHGTAAEPPAGAPGPRT